MRKIFQHCSEQAPVKSFDGLQLPSDVAVYVSKATKICSQNFFVDL